MSNAEYHADFSRVSASMLKVFLDSRREYEARYVTRTMDAEPPSDPMQLGSLAHAMLLEPHTLSEFVEIPENVLAKNGYRSGKAWDSFVADNPGRTLLKAEEFDVARKMVSSIKEKCGVWFDKIGEPEQPLLWTCPMSGLPCKAKPDYLIRKSDRIVCLDVKTASDAMPSGFRNSVKRYRYYMQEFHYRQGIASTSGFAAEFYFVVVQSKPPYQCRVYELPEDENCPQWSRIDRKFAAELYETAMRSLADCYRDNDFSDPYENDSMPLYYESCQ